MKSPLRYPGGKSRAMKTLLHYVPLYEEYREPFVGGGSLFLTLKELFSARKYWINDLHEDLYFFWFCLKHKPRELIQRVQAIKDRESDGRKLYEQMRFMKSTNGLDRAVRFFVLSRISFSGTVDSGGYSEHAFYNRFTQSAIQRLEDAATMLPDTRITKLDYETVVTAPGNNVFLFLDPPYLSNSSSKLYGNRGDLHYNFDHYRFVEVMKSCPHKWLITYDDCEEIRKLFSFAHIHPFVLQYGMNNYKQKRAKKGKELIITNYEVLPQRVLF